MNWTRIRAGTWHGYVNGQVVAQIVPHESYTRRWPRYLYSLEQGGQWGIVGSIQRAKRIVAKIWERTTHAASA